MAEGLKVESMIALQRILPGSQHKMGILQTAASDKTIKTQLQTLLSLMVYFL